MPDYSGMFKTIRQAGNRLTFQRESVLEVIAESETHLNAQEILRKVRTRYPGFTKSSVYRNLETLTQLGLVTQTDLSGQRGIVYELHRHPPHHHIVCQNCGAIDRVDHSLFLSLEKNLRARYGFHANLDHFAIFGTCRKCAARKSPRGAEDAHS